MTRPRDEIMAAPEAEAALLNQMIAMPDCIADVSTQLNASDFAAPSHQAVYRTLCLLADEGVAAEPLAIKERLLASGSCKTRDEATRWLANIVGSTAHVGGVETCVRSIRCHSARRRGTGVAARIEGICNDQTVADVEQIVDAVEAEALGFAKEMGVSGTGATLEDLWPSVRDWFASSGHVPRTAVATGFTRLDNLLGGGLKAGNMAVLGARPAVGKTSMAVNIIADAIKHGRRVYVAELEMTADELVVKLASTISGVSAAKGIKGERYTPVELKRIDDAMDMVRHADLYIDDRSGVTITRIKSAARRVMRGVEPGEGLVVIDHIGLVRPQGQAGRQPRYVEVGYVSAECKVLAKELGCPVLVLSQLNRESVKESRAPRLSDLRECGDIEQDADVVMLIDRLDPGAPEQEGRPPAGEASIIVAKARMGETGIITMSFDGSTGRFAEVDRHARAPWDDGDYEDVDTSDPDWYRAYTD